MGTGELDSRGSWTDLAGQEGKKEFLQWTGVSRKHGGGVGRGHGEKIRGRREWGQEEKCGCDKQVRGTGAFSAASPVKISEIQSWPETVLLRVMGSRHSLCPIPILILGPKLSGGSTTIC